MKRLKIRATQKEIDSMNDLYAVIANSKEPMLRNLASSFDSQPMNQVERIVARVGVNAEEHYLKAANDAKTLWDGLAKDQRNRATKPRIS